MKSYLFAVSFRLFCIGKASFCFVRSFIVSLCTVVVILIFVSGMRYTTNIHNYLTLSQSLLLLLRQYKVFRLCGKRCFVHSITISFKVTFVRIRSVVLV